MPKLHTHFSPIASRFFDKGEKVSKAYNMPNYGNESLLVYFLEKNYSYFQISTPGVHPVYILSHERLHFKNKKKQDKYTIDPQ